MTAELIPSRAARREFLRRDRALRALSKMEVLVARGDGVKPSMIETLWAMFNDETMVSMGEHGERPLVDTKQKVAIANTFIRVLAMKDLATDARGLSKNVPQTVENHQHLTLVFNKSESEIAAMEPAARDLYLRMSTDALVAARQGS